MLARNFVTEDERIGDAVLRWLELQITEERSDEIIATVIGLIPSVTLRVWLIPIPLGAAKGLLRRLLDHLMPEKFMELVRQLFWRLGWASRVRPEENPFRQ